MSTISPKALEVVELLAATIKAQKVDVPVLPDVAHKVLSLAQNSDSDAAQLAKIIQSDPTIGGHVMRIANSAAYTPNSNLISLQQAITRLGMVEITNIAISTSLNSKLFKAPCYEKNVEDIWKHSLVTALWSKEIARKLRANVEVAFLCGLLHSIGKAVILQAVSETPNPCAVILNDEEINHVFTLYESTINALVANEWQLPEIVAEAITHYRSFDHAPNAQDLAATVLFAHQMASHMLTPEQCSLESLNSSTALERVNLYPDEIQELIDKTGMIQSSMEALTR